MLFCWIFSLPFKIEIKRGILGLIGRRQALSLTLAKANPGGSINAFWDPVITTSRPQASVFKSSTPRL